MAIDLSTFWATWDVVGGNTQATNQYEFWNGMIMANGDVLSNQYEFFKYHNTTRYEWFKNLQGTYPEVYDEYTFYKNTTDPSIFDFSTFYQYGGAYLGTTTTTTAPPGVAWSAQQYSTSGQCSFTTANITFYTAYDSIILIGATIYSDVSCTIPYVGDPTKYYTIKLASDPSPRGYIQIDGSGVVTSSVSCYFNFDLTTGYETNDGGCSDETNAYNLFFSTDPAVVGTAVYSQGEGGQNVGRFIYGNDLWYKDLNSLNVYQLSTTGVVSDIYTCTPPLDPDATAYLAAVVASGGTVNSTITDAVYTLFEDLKTNSLYSKLDVLMPMIGGVKNSILINAISPSGSWSWTEFGTPLTYNVSGITTNSNGALRSDWTLGQLVQSTTGSSHFSMYCSVPPVSNNSFNGMLITSPSTTRFATGFYGNQPYMGQWQLGQGFGGGSSQIKGLWTANKISIDTLQFYRNATIDINTSDSGGASITSQNIAIGTLYWPGQGYPNNLYPSDLYTATFATLTIGSGMSSGDMTNLNNIITTFNTTLSRN